MLNEQTGWPTIPGKCSWVNSSGGLGWPTVPVLEQIGVADPPLIGSTYPLDHQQAPSTMASLYGRGTQCCWGKVTNTSAPLTPPSKNDITTTMQEKDKVTTKQQHTTMTHQQHATMKTCHNNTTTAMTWTKDMTTRPCEDKATKRTWRRNHTSQTVIRASTSV